MDVDFEEILSKCGNSHRYQYMLLALYGYIVFIFSRHIFAQNVIGFIPDHWCYHEELENSTFEEIKAMYSQFESPSCTRLDAIDLVSGNVTISDKKCDRWIYDYDFDFVSINAEFNWVCDEALKGRVGQSLFFVGSMFGTFFFGLLGDRIGRIRPLILVYSCGFLGDFATIFAKDLTTYSISRFVSGLAAGSGYLMFILVLEYISSSLRNKTLTIIQSLCYSLGLISACLQAIYTGHWRICMAWSAFPLLLVTLFYFLVQESAQWLITRNDIDGAVMRLQRVAEFNRRQVSEEDFESFRRHCVGFSKEFREKQTTLVDALHIPRLRKTIIKVVIFLTTTTVCNIALYRNVEGVGISPFIMLSLNALTMPPSGFIQAQLQKRFGPKFTLFSALLAIGIFTAVHGIFLSIWKQPSITLLVIMVMAFNFGVSVVARANMQFCAELIPTCVRSQVISFASVSGAAASSLTPYILHLEIYLRAAPSIFLCLLTLFSAWICLLLPETFKKKLPISLADGEEFGVGERMFSFLKGNKKDARDGRSAETQENLMPK
ncbi:uncharacterized protein Dwil_GK13458 [Drosophila willistoni]|uniref:Major facilitator superfamily (MFS) profile domain-containing protein n=1 Tax=Drosophila willistoni TaxID=7260 RepID=B4NJ65_DROWI|nr:organic cation transporter 1 [Drosophila willistoni]EDW83858.2 uncharacterized protein Dwil_GK13458 [Drosophila willistoni]